MSKFYLRADGFHFFKKCEAMISERMKNIIMACKASTGLPWRRIPRRRAATFSSSPAIAASNSPPVTSFKDVHALVNDNEGSKPAPVFHRVRLASSALRSWRSPPASPSKRVVLYFTSLRVVRKTFEDCRAVRSILRGLRVAIDERDLSMDKGFVAELKGILGRRQPSLPQVFIGGQCIGGADEIRRLFEAGELKRYVDGVWAGGEEGFVEHQNCDGSHKVYTKKSGFQSCNLFSENGLVRCPDCRSPAV